MATDTSVHRAASPVAMARLSRVRWSADAWTAIAVVAIFLSITSWWLSQDRSIPIYDAGLHLSSAMNVYEHLRSGSIGAALTLTLPYPPFVFLVGALGLWIGGFSVAAPILAQNLVFVPLLALGCYHVGRLAFGSRAGLLAVVVALGSPLIAAQFHVFMIDTPETAMVAVSVWLILASDSFARVGMSAAAGVAVGLGMLTKEPFVFFVAGVVGVALVRAARRAWHGDRRAWRGFAAFALPALAIALPWYVHYLSQVKALAQGATVAGQAGAYSGIAPPPLSGENLTWYFWNITNAQLYAPLFAFALAGGIWTIVGLARRRPIGPLSWELVVGAFVGWLAITETFVHDTRYSMPLLVYLAVFAGGGIVQLARTPRLLATGALVLIAAANTLAVNSGVGELLRVRLPGANLNVMESPGAVTLYANSGFMVGKPSRDGDVLGLMQALRRGGVRAIAWINLSPREPPPSLTPIFSKAGLKVFARIAKLEVIPTESWELELSGPRAPTAHDATLGHGPIEAGQAPPCVRLSDGSGVWVRFGNPNALGVRDYCPYRHPAFYG